MCEAAIIVAKLRRSHHENSFIFVLFFFLLFFVGKMIRNINVAREIVQVWFSLQKKEDFTLSSLFPKSQLKKEKKKKECLEPQTFLITTQVNVDEICQNSFNQN